MVSLSVALRAPVALPGAVPPEGQALRPTTACVFLLFSVVTWQAEQGDPACCKFRISLLQLLAIQNVLHPMSIRVELPLRVLHIE